MLIGFIGGKLTVKLIGFVGVMLASDLMEPTVKSLEFFGLRFDRANSQIAGIYCFVLRIPIKCTTLKYFDAKMLEWKILLLILTSLFSRLPHPIKSRNK